MFFFIINEIELNKNKDSIEQDLKSLQLNKYFLYIRRLCPQRTTSRINYPTLVSKMRKKFNIDEKAVKKILKKFVDDKILLVGYDDEVRVNILANENRKKILNLIIQYPGVYINFIKLKLNQNPRQLLWHLAFLVKFDYIIEHSIGKFKPYGESTIDLKCILIGFVILKDSMREIVKILFNSIDGLDSIELSETLGIPKATSVYTLKKLEKLKIVVSNKSGRRLVYFIEHTYNELIKNALEKYLYIRL